ncbi:MAG: HU family DNA-binding protein [Acidimicrobiia bacterium]
MNKRELVDRVAGVTNETKGTVGDVIDATLDAITKALTGGEKVQLTGFGTFEARDRKQRMARNPRTGATVFVPAQKQPAFKAGKGLKDAVNFR